MTRIGISAGEQRGFVERRRHNAVDLMLDRERYRALDGAAGKSTSRRGIRSYIPDARALVDIDARARRPHKNKIGGSAHFARRRRLCNDLWSNSSNVAERDGEPNPIA